MLIDWFTVSAQIINFAVLIWLLKRFLYKPLLDALDLREKTIADNLKNAADAKAEAETERLAFQQKNLDIDHRKNELLAAAQLGAEQERQSLLDKARNQVAVQQTEWEQAMRQEQEAFFEQLGKQVQQEVQLVARRFLQELADADLEERMVMTFIKRLADTNPAAAALQELFENADNRIVVRSAFDLPKKLQQLIIEAIHQKMNADINVAFEQSRELLCGIELFANGKKLAWTMTQYLTGLRQNVEKILERKKEADGVG
ncbi:MAG: F0F1 ATP synthase subunit B [Negativicutes bacterium]|jgi:F-type H+-transporting ATPase subunit b